MNFLSRDLGWFGRSKDEFLQFPRAVIREMGHALRVAQKGGLAGIAKPMRGFGGAAVVEIVIRYRGDAFRMIYTTALKDRIWVLYAFKKKSTRGISTPKPDVDVIRARLAALLERNGQ